jgi:hypothetical protein
LIGIREREARERETREEGEKVPIYFFWLALERKWNERPNLCRPQRIPICVAFYFFVLYLFFMFLTNIAYTVCKLFIYNTFFM